MKRTCFPKPCKQCGKTFTPRKTKTKYCSVDCYAQASLGAGSWRWRGGYGSLADGRLWVWDVSPISRKLEYRVFAERALGHPLPPKAVVHHWDEDVTNNAPSNLVICEDRAYHKLLHARARRLRDTGSLDMKRCPDCNTVKPLSDFAQQVNAKRRTWDGRLHYCKACLLLRGRAQYEKRRQQHANPAP